MGQLQAIEEELVKLGYQILAISPDKPDNLQPTVDKHSLGYKLLSDSKLEAARGLGLVFQLDDATVERYKGFGIDLAASSGESHHQLPVPAIYIFDTDGKVVFQYVNPDYRIRIPASVVVAAAREMAK